MKKIALILLICIYGLSAFGLGIKQFYCCGELKSTGIIFLFKDSREKCSDGDDTTDCCKTKISSLKVKDNHVPSDAITNPLKYAVDITFYLVPLEIPTFSQDSMTMANPGHAPPLLDNISIYILHCVFRL